MELLPVANTDWMKTHFGNHFTQEHSLSVKGGSDKSQYYLSGNYLDQRGLLNYGDDNKKRYSFNAKIDADITDKVMVRYNIRFVRSDYDAPSYMNDVFYHNVARYWPIIPLKDPNGFYTGDSKVYQLTEGGRYKTQDDQLTQQLRLVVSPIKNMNINAELNYRIGNNFYHTDWLTTYAYDVDGNPFVYDNATSSVREYAYKSNFFNTNIFADYSKELESGHNFKGMVGFQSELYKDRSITASKDIVQSIEHPTLNTAEKNPQNSGGYGHWATAGFFGRLNYDYMGKYLAEVNLRYDGTSRFLKDERWNLFPSFSLGWNIARESFFENYVDKISTLKIRASWGELGNQNTDNWYPFYRTIRYSGNAGNWLINGAKPNTAAEGPLVSALLTWERIRTTNLGLDFSMLSSRLTGSFDWFVRESLDMVGPAPELPATLGTDVPKVNNLNMESKGFEFVLSWRDKISDFNYNISFNLADSRQKITKYPNPAKVLGTYYSGAYIGDIWGFETIGIAKTNEEMNDHLASLPNGGQSAIGSGWRVGDIMYKDLDGNGAIDTGEGTADKPGDRKIIGNSTPRYNFGLNLSGEWKGFDLNLFFQGVLKRDYMASGMMFWGADGGKWQSMVYKPQHDSALNNDEGQDEQIDALGERVAESAFNLLNSWQLIPGKTSEGTIDVSILRKWIDDVIKLSEQRGFTEVALCSIGTALSYSEGEADGQWPCNSVCEILEHYNDDRINLNFRIGIRNQRGATVRGLFDGGAQERVLVDKYKGYAYIVMANYPRVSIVLNDIAKDYECDARREDERAEKNRIKYE